MLKLSFLLGVCLLGLINSATIPPPQFVPIGPDTILPPPPKPVVPSFSPTQRPVNIPSFAPTQKPVNIPSFTPIQRPNQPGVAFTPNPLPGFLDMIFPVLDNSNHPAENIPEIPVRVPEPGVHPENFPEVSVSFPMPAPAPGPGI